MPSSRLWRPRFIPPSVALVIFLVSFLTGLYFINEGLFHYDSVILAQAVEKTYATHALQPAINGRYGSVLVASLAYAPWYLAGQDADYCIRFTSVLFGALSVVALFFFVAGLTRDRMHGLWAAVLLAFTPFYLSVNTYGKEHSMSIFFLLLSFLLLLRGVQRNHCGVVAGASVAYALALSVRESILPTLPLFLLLYFSAGMAGKPFTVASVLERFKGRLFFCWLVPLAVLIGILMYSYMGDVLWRTLFYTGTDIVIYQGLFSSALKRAVFDLVYAVSLPLAVCALLGVLYLWRRQDGFTALFISVWMGLFFYYGNTDSYCARHLDVPVIPLYIVSYYPFATWSRSGRSIRVLILLYFLSYMMMNIFPVLSSRRHFNGEKRFAQYVQEHTPADALIIVMDDSPFIEYYGKRKTLQFQTQSPRQLVEFAGRVKRLVESGIPVFLVESALSYDSERLLYETLKGAVRMTIVGSAPYEDYHRTEMFLCGMAQMLVKIKPRIQNTKSSAKLWTG